MGKNKKLQKAFGIGEDGIILVPFKYSNVKLSRLDNYDKMGGCYFCFPHGVDCINSKQSNIQRNWKRFRKTQYKTSHKEKS